MFHRSSSFRLKEKFWLTRADSSSGMLLESCPKELLAMFNKKIIRRLISPSLTLLLFVNGLALFAQAQKGRPVIINADQPNVWTLEQAHYLLEQMHRRNLDLKAKSLEE